jgi:hypothetical protein
VLHAAVEPANYKVLLHYHYPDACPFFPLYLSMAAHLELHILALEFLL